MEPVIFGEHEQKVVDQLHRCLAPEEGARGALCADGHYGYSAPIGGVMAYREHVSPSGVGYDIGCIAAGELVLTSDGTVPIERLAVGDGPVRPGADGMLRPIEPFLGVIGRGRRAVVRLTLADGRTVRLTPDHEIRTPNGWIRADKLTRADHVLGPVTSGLPREAEFSGAFLRLAGYVTGGGHLAPSGRYASVFTSVPDDAARIADAVHEVTGGYRPPIYTRTRPDGSLEAHVRINNKDLVDQLATFGCPVGRKAGRWGTGLSQRLLDLPGWARAQYLAGFAGVEATTPVYAAWPVDLAIKQRGADAMADVCAASLVSADSGPSPSACVHLMYRRGRLRVSRGHVVGGSALGACCWIAVRDVEPAGEAEVYDVVTDDPEQAFVVNGVTVHNCGNLAVRTDLRAGELRPDLSGLMDRIFGEISFGVGRVNDERVEHPVLDAVREAEFEPQRQLHKLASRQLGTVGAGNHYVDLFSDENGAVWVGVHFGSRGFGHKTTTMFTGDGGMDAPPTLLRVDSERGQAYISAMKLAGAYAYAGREVVVAKVLEILGARSLEEVHNHHNFAFEEEHDGERFWVVRKGSTPAFPGQKGFVGSTMGEDSVILEGVDSQLSASALYSTVHGAGRAMSRTRAAGKWRKGAQVRPGAIDWPAVRAQLRARGIELRGAAADEAPGAYKRLDDVLAAHRGTVRVLHTLIPMGVAMAGAGVYDPFKD